MPTIDQNDRLLTRIIVCGFSGAFGLVIASLQALRRTSTGFAIELSWWTLVTLAIGAVLMLPFFYLIICSSRVALRRLALAFVVLVGLCSFFYPMRVVPQERLRSVFIGLVAAVAVLSMVAALLIALFRFFEREEKRGRG